MPIVYNPRLATDGLVLSLDAANPRSYVEGSFDWKGINRGADINATLVNSPSFSNVNLGAVNFNGTNQNVLVNSDASPVTIPSTNGWTASLWLNNNNFLQYASTTRTLLGNVNTSTPGWFSLVSDYSIYAIRSIAHDPINQKIYVGGVYTRYGETPTTGLVRLNYDGSLDTSFVVDIPLSQVIHVIRLSATGKIYVGGFFTSINGVPANRIARLNQDGTIDSSFVYGSGFNQNVWDIVEDSQGNVYVAGAFTSYKGVSNNNKIIKLDAFGNKVTAFNNALGLRGNSDTNFTDTNEGNVIAYSLSLSDDESTLYVGGAFRSYKASVQNASRFAAINTADGSLSTAIDASVGFNNTVLSLVKTDDGLYAGGAFTAYQGTAANRIVKIAFDGQIDTSFNYGSGFNSQVQALAEDGSGNLYVGGTFTTYQGVTNNRIIRLLSTGAKDTSFNNAVGAASTVFALLPFLEGTVFVAGSLPTYRGVIARGIALVRSDGNYESTWSSNPGFDGSYRLRLVYYHRASNNSVTAAQFHFNPLSFIYWPYDVLNEFIANRWINLVVVMPADGTNCVAYINGVRSQSVLNLATSIDRTLSFNRIGAQGTGSAAYSGLLSRLSLYNRALSFEEIYQNFSAIKGRYGL